MEMYITSSVFLLFGVDWKYTAINTDMNHNLNTSSAVEQ